jgi:oxygen-independent coproporphyrinogen-3 oxidase
MPDPMLSPLDRLAANLRRGGGRYALYPAPCAFRPFTDAEFRAAVKASNGDPIPAPIALHFDIPAIQRSGFCGLDRPRHGVGQARADAYRDRLVREIGLVGSLFDRDRDVVQVSLAPGMTRWMDAGQVGELIESLDRHFHLRSADAVDFAMTLDLDTLGTTPLRDWARLGFGRVGIGLAGVVEPGGSAAFDAGAIIGGVESVRAAGFSNLRVEVPYGLPGQCESALESLLAATIAAEPDRIGVRNCAIGTEDGLSSGVPEPMQARLLLRAADRLEEAGYLHVGLDVFARPQDPLIAARKHGSLHRDALGYGVHGAVDLIGFGVAAISQMGGCHAQNPLDLATWEARLDRGQRAVDHGIELEDDDRIRAAVIQEILCHGRISTAVIEEQFGLDFREHFAEALLRLVPLFEEGSLVPDGRTIQLDRIARLSARAVACCFDRWNRTHARKFTPQPPRPAQLGGGG